MPQTGATLPSVRDVADAIAGAEIVYLDNGYFMQDRVLVEAARLRGIPVVSGHHAVIGGSPLNRLAWNCSGRHLLPGYAAVHALNRTDAGYLRTLGARNVRTIPMPVRTDVFRWRERPASPFILSFLGRLHEQKGVHRLIAVARALRERFGDAIRVRVGGDGPQRADIEALAVEGTVEYVGHVRRTDVPSFLAQSHVLLMPSRFETFGIVAAEAQACGTAVVASDVPALREVVISEGGATVARPDRVEEWLDAIDRVRAHALNAQSSRALAAEAARRYGFETVAAAFDELLAVAVEQGKEHA